MLTHVHHINFMVRDLDAAVARYETAFGVEFLAAERLEERGVELRRFRLGETWIVLVSPFRMSSAPGRWLRQHGEGVFLVSFGVDSLDAALAGLTCVEQSVEGHPRQGIENWQVVDLRPETFYGAPLQLTAEEGSGGHGC